MREEEVERLQGVVRDCVSKQLYSDAIFFANKVASSDVYVQAQAQALFLGHHFRRAFFLLNASKTVLRSVTSPPHASYVLPVQFPLPLSSPCAQVHIPPFIDRIRVESGRCRLLFDREELKEWDQCLSMLGDAKVYDEGNVYDPKDSTVMYLDRDGEEREINISSAICLL